MDHLRQAQAFHDRQTEILRQVREAANPPMILPPSPHSNSSSHPSNPNAFPLQPPSLSPSPHSNSSPHPSNPNAFPLQPPSLPNSECSSNASDHLLEETATSSDGQQELRQRLEASASGYNNLADDPDLNPYGSEAFLQSIADATELRSHAEDRIATQLAMDESTQDSSSLIVAFSLVTKLVKRKRKRKRTKKRIKMTKLLVDETTWN